MEIKGTVLRTLMDWSRASGIVSFCFRFFRFLYCLSCIFSDLYTSCILILLPFSNKTFYLLIKKRKEKKRVFMGCGLRMLDIQDASFATLFLCTHREDM
jgi:hypothetical protein